MPGGALLDPTISIAAASAGPRPDQGIAFAILVIKEVGEDRRVEAGVIEFERQIVAALVGTLRPGCSDLGATDIDPMAGCVIVRPICLGDDPDALGLDAKRNDIALEVAAYLLEGTDVGHVTSPCCFRARDHHGLDGDLEAMKAIDDAPAWAAAKRRTVAVRLSCLARNGLNRGPHGACPVGWESQGKKVDPPPLRLQATEGRSRAFGQIKPKRGRVVPTPNSILRRRRGGRRVPPARGRAFQA